MRLRCKRLDISDRKEEKRRSKMITWLNQCIGRESNPGLADILNPMDLEMATANFTTKPPMQ
jgi:hypothetical protein